MGKPCNPQLSVDPRIIFAPGLYLLPVAPTRKCATKNNDENTCGFHVPNDHNHCGHFFEIQRGLEERTVSVNSPVYLLSWATFVCLFTTSVQPLPFVW